MQQLFPPIDIGTEKLTVRELKLGDAISVGKLNPNLLEHQLSAFLRCITDDPIKPLTMHGQQRYYCLLQYLSAQEKNDLAVEVNINDYLINEPRPYQDSIQIGDISVRQLNGLELEALEKLAEDLEDWIIGAMALQMGTPDYPAVGPFTDARAAADALLERYKAFCELDQDKYNQLREVYIEAEEQLASLLFLGFDHQGVVIYESEGGAGSIPARFSCNAAFYGFTRQLLEELAARSTELTTQCENESE